jgi:hypothetical protein
LFGNLFRKEVSGVEGASLNMITPGSPKLDRSALLDVPTIKRSLGAPQDQDWTNYPTPSRTIRLVMLAVDGRGGSILLTDGVCVARISKRVHIGSADLRGNTAEGEPNLPSASSTMASGIAARMRSGSGSG